MTLKQIKMKPQKMSLAGIQGKLSRAEMKNIMAGAKCCAGCGNTICGTDSCSSTETTLTCGSKTYYCCPKPQQ
jgi:hypothetical protein